ncbi:MAG: Normal oxygen consumption protein [Cirrosporium novae-zelandiae]|nr:MAG: Normal oxygen consumption protein [Cirrosporium novae-zelandiae]
MPRQRRGSVAPSRPVAAAPKRPTVAPPAPASARPVSTAAHPPAPVAHQAPPPAAPTQSQGPGLFGQMASTAAGVAVGSSIGHAIGGLFSGGSSSAPAEDQAAPAPATSQPTDNYASSNTWGARSCEIDAKNFTKCLDENNGNMQTCSWFLEQLKACQAAASQY